MDRGAGHSAPSRHLMPTIRGWAVSGAGLALLVLWYLLGERELLLTGAFLLTAQLAAIGFIRFSGPRLSTVRRIQAGTVHSGDTTAVSLVLSNNGTRPLRNIVVTDEVESMGVANFDVSRIHPEEQVSVTYRVTCRPRGVYRVGPAQVKVMDPLGLAEVPTPDGRVDRLVVYPSVDELSGFPVVRGRDPAMAASRPDQTQQGGEDFYTLREYQIGDDLRRVHWPSSAKRQELMIRRMETPWRPRARVLLDVRSRAYRSDEDFEEAVSGAASVLTHLVRSGFDAELWDSRRQPVDARRYPEAMERLALVQMDEAVEIETVATWMRQGGGGGILILVTGTPDDAMFAAQQLLSTQHPTTVLMSIADSADLESFHRMGVTTITAETGQGWTAPWLEAMRSSWKEPSPR